MVNGVLSGTQGMRWMLAIAVGAFLVGCPAVNTPPVKDDKGTKASPKPKTSASPSPAASASASVAPATPVVISQVAPPNGALGAAVTLTVQGLPTVGVSGVKVKFGDKEASALERVDATTLKAIVPATTADGVTVEVSGRVSEKAAFTPISRLEMVAESEDATPTLDATLTMEVGATEAFTIEAFDGKDQKIANPVVTWSVDGTKLEVDAKGVVKALALGEDTVRARSGDLSASKLVKIAEETPLVPQVTGSGPYTVSTLAGSATAGTTDGLGAAAKFVGPRAIAKDTQSTDLIVLDVSVTETLVRRIKLDGTVTTIAGGPRGYADGQGAAAKFQDAYGLVVDSTGHIFVADSQNARIRKITPSGAVSTFAGNGTAAQKDGLGTEAGFETAISLTIDGDDNLYVLDAFAGQTNQTIRKITPDGTVSTLAGGASGYADGQGAAARFKGQGFLRFGTDGLLYLSDILDRRIRTITTSGLAATLVGDGTAGTGAATDNGTGTAAKLGAPGPVVMGPGGTRYYMDTVGRLQALAPDGTVSTAAVFGHPGFADGPMATAKTGGFSDYVMDEAGNLYFPDTSSYRIRKAQRTQAQ